MAKTTRSKHILILFGLLPCFLMACALTSLIPTQESEPTPDMSVAIEQRSKEPFSLPAPLFYLHEGQIWRLDSNNQTPLQITQEGSPVDGFDVSPSNGVLAFISNNNLITTDQNGCDRQVLREGQSLPPITDQLARLNDLDHIASALRSPVWSPDGLQIAFIENGLHVYDLETVQAELIWAQSTTSSEPNLFESVLSWSPDGRYLLVSQYGYPIEALQDRWLSVLKLGGPLYPEIATATQASFTWSPETAYIFLANAAYGTDRSLMRCDTETMQCRMIAEFEPARWYYHYAYPFVTANERLLVFMGASDDPAQPPEAFNLISLSLDGYARASLRSDGYLLNAALWSPDGRGVLITLAQSAGSYPPGTVLWLSTDKQLAIALPVVNATNLRWGGAH